MRFLKRMPLALLLFATMAMAASERNAAVGSDHNRDAAVASRETLNLIPWPSQVKERVGHYTLTDTAVIVSDAAFSDEAAQLAEDWGISLATTGTGIVLTKARGLPSEGYTLDVTPQGVTLSASTPAGAYYGCQTLRQLVTAKTIPCVTIRDEPRAAWRGIMLDVSRHFYGTTEIKTLLDQMAVLKLNTFHWHLTDDYGWRIEIKKYPKLTSVGAWRPVTPMEKDSPYSTDGIYGGFYTHDDIREIVAYAAERHIRVIPEIDMPGHMAAVAAAYPELSPDNGWVPSVQFYKPKKSRCAAICIAREQTVTLCKDVLKEVMELFPSKEIHIGGDEVFYEQWEPCPDMQALKAKLGSEDWEDVQIEFGNEMSDFLEAHGRTAIFWNNIYRMSVDKRSINQFWRDMRPARDFANAGFDIVVSPKKYFYFNQRPSMKALYHFDPFVIEGLSPEAQPHLRGVEGCLWTERVPTWAQVQTYIFPRAIAIAEIAWTPQENMDWESFQKRLPTIAQSLKAE